MEPGHAASDGADCSFVIVGRDARAFGHAVAFANLHTEPLLERQPDLARATATPGDARTMRPVEHRWRLLEQDLQDATEKMDVARAVAAHLPPEPARREVLGERERYVAD